jgi:acyl dehydratase
VTNERETEGEHDLMATFRFDDVDAMNAAASEEFGEWGPELEVTQEMINQFADLTGDHQWIHIDVERAKRESPFGGPIAHGFLTLSLLPRMMTESTTTVTGQVNAANYGATKLRFIAPVPADSAIHCRSRIVEAVAWPKGTLLTTEIEVAVVGADRPALLYAMQTLYM